MAIEDFNPDVWSGQWHKLLALYLYQEGKREVCIALETVQRMVADPRGLNIVVHEDSRGIVIRAVSDDDARLIVEQEPQP